MRIVQIIDSLEAGGAERMAVNYANALSAKIEFSGLIATRNEGLLLNQLNEKVSYLFLRKKKLIDFLAVFRLRKYLKTNKINIIHAHSSSFFMAFLVKLTFPKIKIIWHDHYGISQDLALRKNLALKLSSFFFNGSIAVNAALKNWARSYLWCHNIIYFPNFIEKTSVLEEGINLRGVNGKRIICVANLRPQKNHDLLIDAACLVKDKFPEWSFHLIGKDFEDTYSANLYQKVNKLNLNQTVFFYGGVNNATASLKQVQIAVLPSFSEGLPLSILEYGLHKLAVVATNVGEIPNIITSEKLGLLVESNNAGEFTSAIEKFINNEVYRDEAGSNLHTKVKQNFSEEVIINEYLLWLESFTNFTQ